EVGFLGARLQHVPDHGKFDGNSEVLRTIVDVSRVSEGHLFSTLNHDVHRRLLKEKRGLGRMRVAIELQRRDYRFVPAIRTGVALEPVHELTTKRFGVLHARTIGVY